MEFVKKPDALKQPVKSEQNTVTTTTSLGGSGASVHISVYGECGARYLDPKTSRWLSADPDGRMSINYLEVIFKKNCMIIVI